MSSHRISLSLVIVAHMCGSAFAVEIIAHRGASHDAPENTLPAFRLGWEQQADACELDIHLTRDGRIAVIHDPTIRLGGGVERRVAGQTLEELQEPDAGVWKGAQWKGVKIPSLEEVLAIVPDGKKLFIEIKCGAAILPRLAKVIAASPCKPEQLVIIGFDYQVVTKAKDLLPQHQVQWVVSPEKHSAGRKPALATLIAKARAAHLDGLNLNFAFPITADFVARIHAANLTIHVWTVDNLKDAKRLLAAGVDGITTNRPALLRKSLVPDSIDD